MFDGEKTAVFWVGLLLLGISVMTLFWIIWFALIAILSSSGTYFIWQGWVPSIVGAILFILIGLYMMRSGIVKRKEGKADAKLLQSSTLLSESSKGLCEFR